MKSKIIKVGIDFDGVLVYNPLRIFRLPVYFLKEHFIPRQKTEFYIPKTPLSRFIFWVPHQMSIVPAVGTTLLREAIQNGDIEAHLVSARYGYLHHGLEHWLKWQKLNRLFTTVNANAYDEQPYLYKERMIRELNLDYFIEDNLNIVQYLEPKSRAKVLWIYNIFDREYEYPYKFPYLKKALEAILAEKSTPASGR
jgi:hypothetical protein